MMGWLAGALLGALFGGGLLRVVRAAPPVRPVRLVDRVAPYLGDTLLPSRLLAGPAAAATPYAVARRLLGPVLDELARSVDRVVGGAASVRRRLGGLGSDLSVEEFRLEQVVWAGCGMVGSALFAVGLGALRGAVDPVVVAAAALGGLVGGVLGRDWWLSRRLAQREQAMLAEFPVVADLLALSVVAGEAPVDALARVCRLTGG
jgi:tight adherence protein C